MVLKTYDFDRLADKLKEQAEYFHFNTADMPDILEYTPTKTNPAKSIRHHEKFIDTFAALDEKRTSCLYWFELDEDHKCGELIDTLNASRERLKEQGRLVPVMNRNCNSDVLYLGIRRGGYTTKWQLSNISGRIIQHLGYYDKGSTQGLQLAHWAIPSGVDMTLSVIQFEEGFPNAYLEAFEKIMAYRLTPLCGKH